MAQLDMFDPNGHLCTVTVQDHNVDRFVAEKLAAGWSFGARVDDDAEESADEGSPDSDVEELE